MEYVIFDRENRIGKAQCATSDCQLIIFHLIMTCRNILLPSNKGCEAAKQNKGL
jgi:hypothetical protein